MKNSTKKILWEEEHTITEIGLLNIEGILQKLNAGYLINVAVNKT